MGPRDPLVFPGCHCHQVLPLWSQDPLAVPGTYCGPLAPIGFPGHVVVPGLRCNGTPLWYSGPLVVPRLQASVLLFNLHCIPHQSSDHTPSKKSWNPWILVWFFNIFGDYYLALVHHWRLD